MADDSKYFAIRRLTTTTTTFIPVTCPIVCSQVVIENTDSVNAHTVRTDVADGATEKTLPQGAEITLRATAPCWNQGDVVCHLIAVAGSGPVVVSYLL